MAAVAAQPWPCRDRATRTGAARLMALVATGKEHMQPGTETAHQPHEGKCQPSGHGLSEMATHVQFGCMYTVVL